ncbi:hypothetical protein [Rhodospirillum centenum]|uniref:Uncharacterized protein n=1 Tax=Rhodospirillum centenum (strain ATCC 51521 / SW) TaxID=414684 RepID=B6IQ83_RHOCS|nr:hypothetical protein [Rhodospirillum centenum]ACI97619.1 hypothetical protein RC1_0170 [Rhodospirillum centenum SW]
MMHRLAAALVVALAAGSVPTTLPALAQTEKASGFEGTFRVSGSTGNGRDYRGEAKVVRTGDTYTIAWRIGTEHHFGTGIVSGGQLSAVFASGPHAPPGVAIYRPTPDGRVIGVYTILGGTSTALETWEREATPAP